MSVKITVSNVHLVKAVKTELEKHGVFDKSCKIATDNSGNKVLVANGSVDQISSILASLNESTVSVCATEKAPEQKNDLSSLLADFIQQHQLPNEGLAVPKRWSLYKPMVLFNDGSFDGWDEFLRDHGQEFFHFLLERKFHGFTHVAVNKPIIEQDVMRRPFNVVPLYGDFGPEPTPQLLESPQHSDLQEAFWCSTTQNGIAQVWAPRYTMFSRGNIKEKKRLLDSCQNLQGQGVVDMYAGIGYFTLSYLANGATVFCWEINPWSIEGLCRGLAANKHKYAVVGPDEDLTARRFTELLQLGVRAFVFPESNENASARLHQLNFPILHYNLGLLPLLEPLWPVVKTIQTMQSHHLVVHIHENVHKDQFPEATAKAELAFHGKCIHLEKVKTFAPDVWHVVIDVEV